MGETVIKTDASGKKRICGDGGKLFYSDGRASLAARVWCFMQFRHMSDADYEAGTALEWSCQYRGDGYFDLHRATVVLDPPSRGKKSYAAMQQEIDAAIVKALPRKLFEEKFVVLTRRDKERMAREQHFKEMRERRAVEAARKAKEAEEAAAAADTTDGASAPTEDPPERGAASSEST